MTRQTNRALVFCRYSVISVVALRGRTFPRFCLLATKYYSALYPPFSMEISRTDPTGHHSFCEREPSTITVEV